MQTWIPVPGPLLMNYTIGGNLFSYLQYQFLHLQCTYANLQNGCQRELNHNSEGSGGPQSSASFLVLLLCQFPAPASFLLSHWLVPVDCDSRNFLRPVHHHMPATGTWTMWSLVKQHLPWSSDPICFYCVILGKFINFSPTVSLSVKWGDS